MYSAEIEKVGQQRYQPAVWLQIDRIGDVRAALHCLQRPQSRPSMNALDVADQHLVSGIDAAHLADEAAAARPDLEARADQFRRDPKHAQPQFVGPPVRVTGE